LRWRRIAAQFVSPDLLQETKTQPRRVSIPTPRGSALRRLASNATPPKHRLSAGDRWAAHASGIRVPPKTPPMLSLSWFPESLNPAMGARGADALSHVVIGARFSFFHQRTG